jgi:hypothetical protein
MTSTEIANAIQARGGEVPGGDKRSNEWRHAAQQELVKLG